MNNLLNQWLLGFDQRWRSLSIPSKFMVAFGVLLVVIVLTAGTGLLVLTAVRQQTEATILKSIEVQQRIWEMDEALQQARLLERDFFLNWPTLGTDTARTEYVIPHIRLMERVTQQDTELQELLAAPDLSENLYSSREELTSYISLLNLYGESFREAARLVDQLGRPETGLQPQLLRNYEQLHTAIEATGQLNLIALSREIHAHQSEYLLTRQRPVMQQAINLAQTLPTELAGLPPNQQSEINDRLASYLTSVEALLALDNEIAGLRNSFDLQATAVEPISSRLLALARAEVEQGRERIVRTSQFANAILIMAVVAAVIFAILIGVLLNRSITHNVTKLTRAAAELQAGNLQTYADVDSTDELGQLADTFNLLVGQIHELVDELEGKAVEAQSRLLEAIESISEGFSLYDSNDRLMLCNSKYRELQGPAASIVMPGTRFEQIIRAAAKSGHYVDAQGREKAWIEQRLALHRRPRGAFEQHLADDRWVQVSEYETKEGGIFGIYTDITARKEVEEALRQQNNYLSVLHETTMGMISHLDLNELLEDIINRAGQLLGTPHGYIYLVEPTGVELERKIATGFYSDQPAGKRLQAGEDLAGQVWQTGQPLVVDDYQTWSGRSAKLTYENIGSMAGVPLKSQQRVVGVIGMAYGTAANRHFGPEEIGLLARFGELASLALENARLYTTAQQEKKRSDNLLNVVIPIGVALSAEQNFDRLLEKILLEAKQFCNADAGTLYLRTDNDELRFVIVRNDSLNITMGGTSGHPIDFDPIPLYDAETGQPNHSNVAAHVAITGEGINIVDAYQVQGFNFSGTQAFDRSTGYRSMSFLTIPLKNAHQRVVGVLQLINALAPNTDRIIPFSHTLEQIVSSLSSLATVALEAYVREHSLRQQIQQLRIEIDEAKRQKQVTEIVETDFFQDLQTKARGIRRRGRSGSSEEES